MNVRLTVLQIDVNRATQTLDEARRRARDAQSLIDEITSRLDGVRRLATSQAIAIYEGGPVDPLSALLDSKSLSQLGDRAEMLDVATRSNTKALISYSRMTARIRYENGQLLRRRTEAARELETKQSLENRISSARADLHFQMTKLIGNVSSLKDKERGLASKSKALKKAITRHRAMATVASLGVSKQDYIWPLNGAINSPYGPRWGSFHPGIDINGYTGEPYMAAHSGLVLIAGWVDGYGNAVVVDTGGGVQNVYGHASALRVSAGDNVKQGQVLGLVGCTGYCTGPHLHFEIRVNGKHVNPMPFLPNGSDRRRPSRPAPHMHLPVSGGAAQG
jgi:murein DD-endopeptidase MepM/ murein hydrolase activator NlpD